MSLTVTFVFLHTTKMSEDTTFNELLNNSIRLTENTGTSVNYESLHSLLLAMLKHLDIEVKEIQWEDDGIVVAGEAQTQSCQALNLVQGLQHQNNSLEKEIKELQDQNEIMRKEITELRQQNTDLRNDIVELNQDKENKKSIKTENKDRDSAKSKKSFTKETTKPR